jgi:hypothetical protein
VPLQQQKMSNNADQQSHASRLVLSYVGHPVHLELKCKLRNISLVVWHNINSEDMHCHQESFKNYTYTIKNKVKEIEPIFKTFLEV